MRRRFRSPDLARSRAGVTPMAMWITAFLFLSAAIATPALAEADPADGNTPKQTDASNADEAAGQVRCANLVYGRGKSSVCFSDAFLDQLARDTNVRAHERLFRVKLESPKLYQHPFAVMTGEGRFELTSAQRDAMRDYLRLGGFIVASAGCSSRPWNRSFQREMHKLFPDTSLTKLDADHPIFHTVYDVTEVKSKSGKRQLPDLRALTLDGRVVLVWSPDGLNDTENAAPECCCCGGTELKSARRLNVNILAYALTH